MVKGEGNVAALKVVSRTGARPEVVRDEAPLWIEDRDVVLLGHGVRVGARQLCVIAGPCSVESEAQMLRAAKAVVEHGAQALRGGAFKPRTSPYSFQGLGSDALRFLAAARELVQRPVVSEVIDVRQIEEMAPYVDVFQVGARNMFNYPLLKELGSLRKPVLLKRGMMATLDEFVGAVEYLRSRGNNAVILCERGIRHFDSSTRFCLDLAAIPVLRERTRLPIIVDPSHGTGVARYVESMALAAVAAGADGLMIEVHNEPETALSDGRQAITFEQFAELCRNVERVAYAVGRTF